jgi:2',3'-cyclic-nucleotide 2'-phosphodiesterase/3'-nucleotidase
MTLGNHEFDWGIDKLKEIEKNAKFTVLAANIYDKNTGKRVDFAQPYKIVEKKGIKVGIIGVTTPETPSITLPAYTKDLVFKDPADEVNSLIDEVKAKGADVIVVVGHIGGKQDSATGTISGEVADMAAKLDSSKVAAIISGHSHETVAGSVNGIAVVQGYYNGRAVEHISLTIDPSTKKVVSAVAAAEDCYKKYTEITPDENVQKIVDYAKVQVGTVFDEVVGKSSVDLTLNFNGESNAGNFVTDVMRMAVKVDAAFEVPGDLRSDIAKGNVTVGDLYKLLPWDNTIYTMKLTGAQIKEILEQGATLDKGMIQVSGIKFKYDPDKEKGHKVYEIKLSNGTTIDMNKEYTVAANDYVATGGDNFSTFLKGKDTVNTYIMERDTVNDYIKELNKKGGSVNTAVEGRIVAAKQPAPAPIQLNTYKTVKIMAKKGLRIRAAASTSSRILGAMKYGTSIVVLEDLGQWYKIRYNGVDAYIFKAYTK